MFRLAVVVGSIIGVVALLALGFQAVVSWEISGIMAAVVIGIATLLLAYLPREEKKKAAEKTQVSIQIPAKQAPSLTPRPIMNETIVAGYDEYFTYEINAKAGVEIRGEISSDKPISFHFLTKHGLSRYENDEEYSEVYGSGSCLRSEVHFIPSRTRMLYLVIESDVGEDATVRVNLHAIERARS